MFPSFLSPGNRLADRGWPLPPIIIATVLVQMILAGTVVLFILPLILEQGKPWNWLAGFLRLDGKSALLGLLSFALFGILAALLALALGIFKGDLSVVLARPDLRPDSDVVGWEYFLLALVPGIWEELAFRGLIQARARRVFSAPVAVFLSATFFGLFHFTLMATQTPDQVVSKVIMAFLFGIGWGYMTVRARSVVPAMLSHYLVDFLGSLFLKVDTTDPALATAFFLLLTLIFPVLNIVLARVLYREAAPWPSGALEF